MCDIFQEKAVIDAAAVDDDDKLDLCAREMEVNVFTWVRYAKVTQLARVKSVCDTLLCVWCNGDVA